MSVQAEERDFMKKKKHIISRVLPGSIAQELELEPGDILAAINDTPVEDVFDYRYLCIPCGCDDGNDFHISAGKAEKALIGGRG